MQSLRFLHGYSHQRKMAPDTNTLGGCGQLYPEINTIFISPCLFTENALIQFKQPMLVYEQYFNAGVSTYILHITIFTFATCTPPPPFNKHYQMSPSSSSMAVSSNRHFVIAAAVRFGRNSVADGFNSFFFSFPFVVVIPSQYNPNG